MDQWPGVRIKNRGEITNMAYFLGITRKHLSLVIHGHKRPSVELAKRLEEVTGVDRRAWLWPDEFPNPYFSQDDPDEEGLGF